MNMEIERKLITYLNFGSFPGLIQFSSGFTYNEIMKIQKTDPESKEWRIALRPDKELIDSGDYWALKRRSRNIDYFFLIMVPPFSFSDKDYCILAHEVLHLCQFRLTGTLDRNTEVEAEAYTHTHIMEQCLKALRGNAK